MHVISCKSVDFHDVAVVGAGPAGCEASLAAAAAGASTICLTINLDAVALHPANPVLADGTGDPRMQLLKELHGAGAALPGLLQEPGVSIESGARTVIDRRVLGLAYKERLESANGLFPRQSLVTSISAGKGIWNVTTSLGENFRAAAVVVAAGTYLNGVVTAGGVSTPGGRHGDIPANALARCIKSLGIAMERTTATSYPRLDARRADNAAEGLRPPDEAVLGELYGTDIDVDGNGASALKQLRRTAGCSDGWITRLGYTVEHHILTVDQVDPNLQALRQNGLFFAGKVAGSCNYTEAASLGFVAGINAAALAAGEGRNKLTTNHILITKLCCAVSKQQSRPVTIRIPPPGC